MNLSWLCNMSSSCKKEERNAYELMQSERVRKGKGFATKHSVHISSIIEAIPLANYIASDPVQTALAADGVESMGFGLQLNSFNAQLAGLCQPRVTRVGLQPENLADRLCEPNMKHS
eukprot:scaffold90623_cov18-Tisochrysis_lutea.AAC.1